MDSVGVSSAQSVGGTPSPSSRVPVSVVIPVLNEEKNLPEVLQNLPALVDEVIIVDGLSRDGSIDIARRLRPDCQIVLETRKGKGVAIRAGLNAARGEYIILLDADCSHSPHEITRMIDRLEAGADLVHGSRFLPGGGSADLTSFRFLGNKIFVWLTNFLHGTNYTDVLYGYHGLRRSALDRLPLAAESMEIEVELLIGAHKAGLRVSEISSFERRRLDGHSRLSVVRDGWRILRKIIHDRFRA